MSFRDSLCLFAAVIFSVPANGATAQERPEQAPRVRYFDAGWDFSDVDVATLTRRLESIGIELPVDLSGRISVSLNVGIPWGAMNRAKAWRFDGRLTSGALVVENFPLEDVRVFIQYRDGVLALRQLEVAVAAGDEPPGLRGVARGTARMELIPRGEFSTSVRMTGIPLRALAAFWEAVQGLDGRLAGSLEAAVPVGQITDAAAWHGNGSLELSSLTLHDISQANASAHLTFERGEFTVRELQLTAGATQVTGNAALSLQRRQPWKADVVVASSDISELLRNVSNVAGGAAFGKIASVVAKGEVHATASASGALSDAGRLAIEGRATLESVSVEPNAVGSATPLKSLVIERLGFDYRFADDRVAVSRLQAVVADGTITGAVRLPLSDGELNLDLQWNHLRLSEALDWPFNEAGASSGVLSASAPVAALEDLTRWKVVASASLTELTLAGVRATELKTESVTLGNGRLAMTQFSARLGGELATVSLQLQLDGRRTVQSTFNVSRLQLDLLRNVPQFQSYFGELGGVVSVSGKISGRWQPLDLAVQGELRGDDVRVAGREIDSLQFRFDATRRRVRLSSIDSRLYGGKAAGSVEITLGDRVGGSGELTWTNVNTERLATGIALGPVAVSGVTHGHANLTVPAGALSDLAQWTGAGSFLIEAVDLYEWRFREMDRVDFSFADSQVKFPRLEGLVDGAPIEASVTVGVTAPHPLEVRGSVQRTRLERLRAISAAREMASRISGEVSFDAHVEGTLSPLRLSASGSAVARELTLDGYAVDHATFAYSYRPEVIKVSDVIAQLYGGKVTGHGAAALVDNGESNIDAKWSELNVGRLLGQALGWRSLDGRTNGELSLQIPPGRYDDLGGWSVKVLFDMPDLRWQGDHVASLAAQLTQNNRELDYSANGELFSGAFNLRGSRRGGGVAAGLALLGSARLSLERAQLQNAVDLLTGGDASAPVAGELSLTAESQLQEGQWRWASAIQLGAVQVDGKLLSEGVDVRATGAKDTIRLESITGRFGGGALAGSGQWTRNTQRGNSFRVGLRGAQLDELMQFAFDRRDVPVRGPLDVEFRMSVGELWRIRGTAVSARILLDGQTVSNVRVPLELTWHPRTSRLEVRSGGLRLALAGGRITGKVEARYLDLWNLDAQFRFSRVDFTGLTGSDYGRGRLTGTLALSGRRIRSANDLSGVLLTDLHDAQASQIPVLSQLRNYVPAIASSATRFGDGRVEARLRRGVVYLEEFYLASVRLKIYMTGRARLDGRLDLEATVATGDRVDSLLARSLVARLALASVAPASLLVTANDFLSDRVIHLAIGGTFTRPTVRIQAYKSLREEAIRFFLRQATQGLVPIGAGASSSTGR